MKILNLIIPYYASMTSVLKFFVLYILSKWYGASFAFPFIFLFSKVYQIIMNKRYNFLPLTIIDYFHILKSIYQKNFIKKINIKSKKKEEIILLIKSFINESIDLKKLLVYKYCNYYWKILNTDELYNKVIIDKEIDNLNKKLTKKLELLKTPNYQIFFDEKGEELVIKYNYITFRYIDLLEKYIFENNDKNSFKNKKMNKLVRLIIEFFTFPIYLGFEIIIVFLLSVS